MNEKLRKIINHYGINKQLKYFQSEIYELNESIIKAENQGVLENVIDGVLKAFCPNTHINYDKKHITEEIADVTVMLKQIQLYYNISTSDIREVMNYKIDRQLNRINEEEKK